MEKPFNVEQLYRQQYGQLLAKNKIRDAGIPYQMPADDELHARLQSVLTAIYLIFNEGWLANGEQQQRMELLEEALRLGNVLSQTMQDNSEVRALLALMVLQHSRRHARFTTEGELVLLADQDRSLWRKDEIQKASTTLEQIFDSGHGLNRHALMAAITFNGAGPALNRSSPGNCR